MCPMPANKIKEWRYKNMEQKLFSKDFTLVVIGQIISLFGNAAIRFALPLYLLNQTGSSALYGTVTACAFIPAILLSPIGGIMADRVNKRNIMVFLDFFTAAVIMVFSLYINDGNLVLLTAAALMLLYGIAGAYQPSVQASIPALVCPAHSMAANSIINTVSSFSALLGPVLGGILYSAYGLLPVLWVCIICFFLSAVMELFICIPSAGQRPGSSLRATVKKDFTESLRFIREEKPVIWKVLFIICGINLFLSSMIVVGLPYLVTEVLPLDAAWANKLCGFAQGALAAGGLTGGISAGIFSQKLTIRKSGYLLMICAGCVFLTGIALAVFSSGISGYLVLTLCCFTVMIFSTIFSVQMMSFVQTETPPELIGKVIAVILTVSMCTQPLGNAFYGVLFEICHGNEFAVILFSGTVSFLIAVNAVKVLKTGVL